MFLQLWKKLFMFSIFDASNLDLNDFKFLQLDKKLAIFLTELVLILLKSIDSRLSQP